MSVFLSTHRNWQFAVGCLYSLSLFPEFPNCEQNSGFTGGDEIFQVLSEIQVESCIQRQPGNVLLVPFPATEIFVQRTLWKGFIKRVIGLAREIYSIWTRKFSN